MNGVPLPRAETLVSKSPSKPGQLTGRRRAPTPSPAPERPGHNAVVTRILALRLVICRRGRRRSPHTPRPLVAAAATRASALGDCWAWRSDSEVCLPVAADRAAGKHLDDSRNRGKGGQPVWTITTPDCRGRGDAHLWRRAGAAAVPGQTPALCSTRYSLFVWVGRYVGRERSLPRGAAYEAAAGGQLGPEGFEGLALEVSL